MQDYEIAAREFAQIVESLGLSMECAFVPFSRSRNANEAHKSLNWRCSIARNGKAINGLEAIDYSQGAGFCPAYKLSVKEAGGLHSIGRADAIAKECETGKEHHPYKILTGAKSIPAPSLADVLQSLCMDVDALDYATFEQWADEMGFDPDSRKWEAVYRQCLSYGLALRAAIGNDDLARLQELARQM